MPKACNYSISHNYFAIILHSVSSHNIYTPVSWIAMIWGIFVDPFLYFLVSY